MCSQCRSCRVPSITCASVVFLLCAHKHVGNFFTQTAGHKTEQETQPCVAMRRSFAIQHISPQIWNLSVATYAWCNALFSTLYDVHAFPIYTYMYILEMHVHHTVWKIRHCIMHMLLPKDSIFVGIYAVSQNFAALPHMVVFLVRFCALLFVWKNSRHACVRIIKTRLKRMLLKGPDKSGTESTLN